MEKEIKIRNLDAMEEFARNLANILPKNSIVCLDGQIGAGKTTFTKFLGKALGITETINSPTYTIMKMYENDPVLYHLDVYRLDGIGHDFELEEYIYDDGIAVIEWYKNIIDVLPEEKLEIVIDISPNNERTLHVKGNGIYESIIEKISN